MHDAGATVFDDYHLLVPVQLQRLTRYSSVLANIRNRERVRFPAPIDMRGEF